MPNTKTNLSEDETLIHKIIAEFEKAKETAKKFDFEEVKNGKWFYQLLQKVVQTHNRNARARYFQKKYPGFTPDEIADRLISVTVRYAAIAGGLAGAAATVDQIGVLASAGMTAALFVGTIGAEMLYLAQIQMRLVLDLSVVYDLQLDLEDPEDVLMVFGYAMGVAPVEMLGKGLERAAGAVAGRAVNNYIAGGTLEAIKKLASKLSFKILQSTIRKYAVPIASGIVGSSYNYATTQAIGSIARAHFKNRGKVTDELRALVSRQTTYDIAFPAAVLYMAEVDGSVVPTEKELYKAMLSRMSFEEHTQAEFHKLLTSEGHILDAIAAMEDEEVRRSLLEMLALMAIYDGELAGQEREFLASAAARLQLSIDLVDIERRAQEYRIVIPKNVFNKAAAGAREKVKGVVDRTLTRKKKAPSQPAAVETSVPPASQACSSCGKEVPAQHRFCPNCGLAQA